MPTDFTMPRLGLTMEEGTVIRWLAAEGQNIAEGEAIVEIQTDKVTVEVEAPVAGVLGTPLVREGQTVPVGALLAWIAEPGAMQPRQLNVTPLARRIAMDSGVDLATIAEGRDPLTADDVRRAVAAEDAVTRHFSSPRARKRAKEAGLDWREISGSGPQGRVIERDVLLDQTVAPSGPLPAQAVTATETTARPGVRWEESTPVQRAAAERTTAVFTSTPHFYLTSEVKADALVEMRERLLPAVERRAAVRLTITDLLVKIAATALLEHPRANAFWENGRIGVHERIDVGLATATPVGLVVPVIRDTARLPLAEIARERGRLVEAARARTLTFEDVRPGTFTLSNLGGHRVDQFHPVLNGPESVILAAGRISPRPFVISGALAVSNTIVLTIACDHRVLDGASAAAFFDRLIQLVEEPYELLV